MAKEELKQPVVTAISEEIKDAQCVVLVDYRGLTVSQDTELRKQLRDEGIQYKVYKNTMMKRAFEGTEFAGLDEYLEGPSAIAISKNDETAPARILSEFAKKAEKLELKAGMVDGIVYDANGLVELAKIPSRDVLLSRLLGSMQSPVANFARVMKQLADKGGAAPDEGSEEVEEPAVEETAEKAVEEEEKAPVEEAKEETEEAAEEATTEETAEETTEETTEE